MSLHQALLSTSFLSKDMMSSYLFYLKIALLVNRYNKKEEDFGSLRKYNDYLEKVETISKFDIQPHPLYVARDSTCVHALLN